MIDVNTGRFVGSRSKSSTQRLEDTIVKNNLEAVKEVVRQLRLRDIGGIIVIDFIDMANPKNRQAVEEALRTELERDRTKTYVVEISPLGLVEMTRQNVTDGPREVMTRKCPTCAGDGIVVSDATVALQVERRLRALAAAGRRLARPGVQGRASTRGRWRSLAGPGGARLAALEEATRRRFYLVPAEGHVHADHFEVLAEGRRDDLAPAAPLEEGAELELKLVEIDLHDATAAVGKLDGVDVVVADAAKLVGKKATVVDRPRARGPGVRDARRRRTPATRRSRSRARPRSRPARPRAGRRARQPSRGSRAARGRTTSPTRPRRRTRPTRPSEPRPRSRARPRRRGRRGRRPRPQADAARLARRQAPQEAAPRPTRRLTRRAPTDRGRRGRRAAAAATPRPADRSAGRARARAPRSRGSTCPRTRASRRPCRPPTDGGASPPTVERSRRGGRPPTSRESPRPTATDGAPAKRDDGAARAAAATGRRSRPRRTATATGTGRRRRRATEAAGAAEPTRGGARRRSRDRRAGRGRRVATTARRGGTSRCPSGSRTSTAAVTPAARRRPLQSGGSRAAARVFLVRRPES